MIERERGWVGWVREMAGPGWDERLRMDGGGGAYVLVGPVGWTVMTLPHTPTLPQQCASQVLQGLPAALAELAHIQLAGTPPTHGPSAPRARQT